ncbi:hypothetical protein DSO57_1026607 [Entomophthora muscae]|uniref:Uncharacterized protein n=1 Tax=Entomophthora muscae TaxID=34485 RepID=A0ACC2TNV0_9FUNG|nr:hypothetical protein DSO57_1026607 [Entomophthora muscae]
MYHLIFLSETWFIDHDQILQHPNLVTHTPLVSFYTNCHQAGEMALFCSGSACALLSFSRCTINTILVSFASLNILGVYFEPSLSKNKVQRLLLSCTKADLVLGDVNI